MAGVRHGHHESTVPHRIRFGKELDRRLARRIETGRKQCDEQCRQSLFHRLRIPARPLGCRRASHPRPARGGRSGGSAASPSISREGDRRRSSRVSHARRSSVCPEPPMSKPLAYPSTLDHRPAACARTDPRPTWRGFGARASASSHEIDRQKLALIRQCHSHRVPRRLSPSGGASIRSRASLAGHHLSSFVGVCRLRNDEGDPSGRPR